MKSFAIVDRAEACQAAIKPFLEPEHEVLECKTLQQLGKLAPGREFCAVFLAWPPGGPEGLKPNQTVPWNAQYLVAVLLQPKEFTLEQFEAEAEHAGKRCKELLPDASFRLIPRLTVREIQRVVSQILACPVLDFPELLGASPEMLRLKRVAPRVAAGDQAVLLIGEPGSGKETLARWIHLRSARGQAGAPFEVYRLCPGLDPVLAAGELCGYDKNAFSWAAKPRGGSLEAANTGTLYIPEVLSLPPQAQLQLVRLLTNPLRGIERLGSDSPQRLDVRIIAGTSQPLGPAAAIQVSADLLNYFQVRLPVPPLHRRVEDIPALSEHFLQQVGAVASLHPKAQAALKRFSWPKNLDELDQALQDASLQVDEGGEILFEHLPAYIQHAVSPLI